jgi:hypothetical protein
LVARIFGRRLNLGDGGELGMRHAGSNLSGGMREPCQLF